MKTVGEKLIEIFKYHFEKAITFINTCDDTEKKKVFVNALTTDIMLKLKQNFLITVKYKNQKMKRVFEEVNDFNKDDSLNYLYSNELGGETITLKEIPIDETDIVKFGNWLRLNYHAVGDSCWAENKDTNELFFTTDELFTVFKKTIENASL